MKWTMMRFLFAALLSVSVAIPALAQMPPQTFNIYSTPQADQTFTDPAGNTTVFHTLGTAANPVQTGVVTFTPAAGGITPDGTISVAPSGAALVSPSGTFSWDGASNGHTGILLGGVANGWGDKMEIAHSGQVYVFSNNAWCCVWNPTTKHWDASAGP